MLDTMFTNTCKLTEKNEILFDEIPKNIFPIYCCLETIIELDFESA